MKAVQLLLESTLPEDLRDPGHVYDAKGLGRIMADVASKYPDRYAEIAKQISDMGRHASYRQGETLRLSDLRPVLDRDTLFGAMDAEVEQARAVPDTFDRTRAEIWQRYSDQLDKQTQDAALKGGNNLAYSVVSGARGKGPQLKAMISTPGLYSDYKGDLVPLFVRRSFGEGLRPAEYLAGAFGARLSVVSTKTGTAKGGDLLKQLSQATARQVVTTRDCGVQNGIDLEPGDDSLRGRVLARAVGKLPAGTLLDRDAARYLAKTKEPVLVRSALTCQARDGVCAACAGATSKGTLPSIGDSVGITAATAVGEPVTQQALNVKHCLLEGTLVRMADFSVRAIQDIKPGEEVMGADITGRSFPVKVLAVWDQGQQQVDRYVYRMGQTKQELILECTNEHPVLSNKKVSSLWAQQHNADGKCGSKNDTKLVKLPAGYKSKRLAAVLPNQCDFDRGQREPLAWLIGVLLGDGNRWASPYHQITFSCADQVQINDMNTALQVHNLHAVKCTRSYDWRISQIEPTISGRDAVTGRLTGGHQHPLKKLLPQWGLAGCYAHEKKIPQASWLWDTRSIAEMIGGFIATDGSVFKNKDGHVGISFSSCSKELVAGLKEIMAVRLCVYSAALTCTGKAGSGNHKHDQWQFTITRLDQVKRLASLMPDIPGVKGDRLKSYLDAVTYQLRNTDIFYRAGRKQIVPIGVRHCWDISVDHPDELFVLANGLIVKNTAGQAAGKKTYSGFDVIDQLVQVPDIFPDRAAVAEAEGRVDAITPAPQGGNIVMIGDTEHYVPPGYAVTVGVGDVVEQGDQLSDGIVSPADVTRLRGLGEGRRYYAKRLKQALDDSGLAASARNVEMMARATVDNVLIETADGVGGYLPDDLASYNRLTTEYTPPPTTRSIPIDRRLAGRYLQRPTLHYSIGTKLTPRMLDHMQTAGFKTIEVSDEPPPFSPEMVRLRTASQTGNDWMSKLHASYVRKNLAESAVRGEDTSLDQNIHFAPRLAIGTDFGKNVRETGKF